MKLKDFYKNTSNNCRRSSVGRATH